MNDVITIHMAFGRRKVPHPGLCFAPRILNTDHVVVNFMSQLDWATGCPDIWSDFIRDVSVMLLTEVPIGMVDCIKQIALPAVSGLIRPADD